MHNNSMVNSNEKDTLRARRIKQSVEDGSALPTIASAADDQEHLRALKNQIYTLNARDRQLFLAGLQATERFLKLHNLWPEPATLFEELKISGIGGAIIFAILSIVFPIEASLAVAAGSTAGRLGRVFLDERDRKSRAIERLKDLRDTVMEAERLNPSG